MREPETEVLVESEYRTDDVTYKDAIKKVLGVTTPYAFSQLCLMAGDLALVYVLSRVDDDHLAASGLISSVQSLYFGTLSSLIQAVSIEVGSAKGRNTSQGTPLTDVGVRYRLGLILSVLLSIPLMAATPFFGKMLIAFDQNKYLADIAQKFFMSRIWGTPFWLGFIANLQIMLGLDHSKAATVFVISESVLSALAGYAFTLGPLFFPQWDEYGLGYSAAGVSVLHFLVSTLYLRCSRNYSAYGLFSTDMQGGWAAFKELLKTGFSIAAQVSVEQVGFGIASILVGKIGGLYLAAQQAAMLWVWLFLTPAIATAEAMGGIISDHNEAGLKKVTRRLGNSSLGVSIAFSLIGLVLFSVLSDRFTRLLLDPEDSDTPLIISIAKSLFIIQGVGLVLDSPRNVNIGLLRGLGDKTYPSAQAFVATGLGIGLGYLLAFPANLKMDGIYIARDVGVAVSLILLTYRWFKKSAYEETRSDTFQSEASPHITSPYVPPGSANSVRIGVFNERAPINRTPGDGRTQSQGPGSRSSRTETRSSKSSKSKSSRSRDPERRSERSVSLSAPGSAMSASRYLAVPDDDHDQASQSTPVSTI